MDELFCKNASDFLKEGMAYADSTEDFFWSWVSHAPPGERDTEALFGSFFHVVDVLTVAKDGFETNYKNAINSAMMIKGISGLNDSLLYDSYYKKDEYKSYVPNISDLAFSGINIENYTPEELKMISYLKETRGWASAECYINMKADAVNRRNGIIDARNFYESLRSGSNQGVDAIWDHFRVDVKGFGDGLYNFTDGLIDLVAPSYQMEQRDYEIIEFLSLLENGDSYDHELLRGYNICNELGNYTIPTLVSFVAPETNLGTALFIASDIGNGIESNMQASYQAMRDYDSDVLDVQDYSSALVSTALPYIYTDLPNDAIQAVVAQVKDVNPFIGAALDMFIDDVMHNVMPSV